MSLKGWIVHHQRSARRVHSTGKQTHSYNGAPEATAEVTPSSGMPRVTPAP